MVLNNARNVAEECWLAIPEHYPNTRLHKYVVMPNPVHGILQITNNVGVGVQNLEPLPSVWHRNYYEHIIRNQQSYDRISEYITNNPSYWLTDKYYEEQIYAPDITPNSETFGGIFR